MHNDRERPPVGERPQNNKPPFGGPPGGGPGGFRPGEKPKDLKKSLKKLFSYCKKYIPIMVVSVCLAISSSVLSLIGPSRLSEITDLIIDGMMTGIDIDAVAQIGLFLVIVYSLSLIFGYTQGNLMATITQKICKSLRTDLVKKLNKLPLSYFDTRSYGDTLSLVTNDVDTIGTSLNQSMSSVITGVFTFVGAVIIMFCTNWIMALAAIISSLVGFSLMTVIIKNSQKFFLAQQNELGTLNGHIEETYTGHTVVKAFGGEKSATEHFNQSNNRLFGAAWKAQFFSGLMMPIMSFVGNFAYVAVCVVGALLTMNDVISFGVIVAFMIYVRIFTQPLATLAQAFTTLQSAAAASERVFKILGETELSEESHKKPYKKEIKGEIEFKNIRFGYNPDKIIIPDFSATINAGQTVAIVGPTGAGKTTLVNLIMRFYELNSGEIYLDGTPISQIRREDLHDIFAMVLQDTWMFEGTISQNIAYNQEQVTQKEIEKACKAVGIHHTIRTLPKGYDTVMSNSTLSVGEKQLLTIARAMVKKAELLILDEATSSVDTRTEILIQKAMDELSKGKTSFVIAHRLSTIKNADLILVMRDGNIVETGNHNELLEKKGFYAELYNSQFEED